MLSIYLDQNKWIDLARADHHRPNGEQFEKTLDLALKAVAVGSVCFPLSAMHYSETLNTGNDNGRRSRLASTMMKLSRFKTLVDPFVMGEEELRSALRTRFGDGVAVRHIPPIGEGSGYAFQQSGPPDYLSMQTLLGFDGWLEFERMKLAGETMQSWDEPARVFREFANTHVQRTEAVDRAFEGNSKSERHKFLWFHETEQLLERCIEILAEDNVGPEHKPNPDWIISLLDDLPLLCAKHHMLMSIYNNRQIPREASNFGDIGGLPQAVVTCDYVVTEKQWVRVLAQAGLGKRFGTTLLSDVRDLVPVLSPLT